MRPLAMSNFRAEQEIITYLRGYRIPGRSLKYLEAHETLTFLFILGPNDLL